VRAVSGRLPESYIIDAYVFDVWARVDGDNITVLDTQVVANDTVYPCRAVIKVVVRKHNQDCVLALLSLHQNGIAAEELKCLHSVVREGNNRVVIVDGVGDAAVVSCCLRSMT
jgi:hypothetical protein